MSFESLGHFQSGIETGIQKAKALDFASVIFCKKNIALG